MGEPTANLSEYLAKATSKSNRIFRRYDTVALRNLLFLSSQLDDIARNPGPPANFNEPIKRYYEALLLYSRVLELKEPANRTVLAVDGWVTKHTNADTAGYHLRHNNNTNHRIENYEDIASLHMPEENDFLTRFARKYLGFLFLDRRLSRPGEYYYDEEKIEKFVTFVNSLLAIGFLVSAMWALWREGDDMVHKLATVTGFVVGFAGWVGFFTSAGRKEVVSATAAYAAVLVVYVSQTPSPPTS